LRTSNTEEVKRYPLIQGIFQEFMLHISNIATFALTEKSLGKDILDGFYTDVAPGTEVDLRCVREHQSMVNRVFRDSAM